MDLPGHRSPSHHGHDDQQALLRGVLRRRPGPGREPGRNVEGNAFKQTMRPARTRAGRHRPPRLQSSPSSTRAVRAAADTDRLVGSVRRSPAIETGYRLGRILVYTRSPPSRPRPDSRPRPSASAPNTRSRVADFVGRGARHAEAVALDASLARGHRLCAPPTRSWAAPVEHHAKHPRGAGAGSPPRTPLTYRPVRVRRGRRLSARPSPTSWGRTRRRCRPLPG